MPRARGSIGKSTRTFKFESQRAYTHLAKSSLQNVLGRFNTFIQNVENTTPQILYDAVKPTYELSQKYCPKDTGDLRASGYIKATGQFVEVGYAKAGKPWYAVYVHEKVENYHYPPTRAKWLQVALEEDLPNIKTRLAGYYGGLVR